MRDIQRTRITNALTQAVAEVGFQGLTVAEVVARAGVSRRTFYELFSDCEECFLAALEESIRRIGARVVPAYEAQGNWQRRIRAGLCALLELLDEDRAMGRLVLVETLAAGPRALDRRGRVLARVAAAIDEGRRAKPVAADPGRLVAEGVVGAVLTVLHTRLLDPRPTPLVQLANPLMSMIVLPYLGPAATRAELRRLLPRTRAKVASEEIEGDLLKGLGMRVTYRTARVLSAIAASPGASNRHIAEQAGVADQGQMSKLLRRLQRLELIENVGEGVERGAPNAWRLTRRGEAVARVVS